MDSRLFYHLASYGNDDTNHYEWLFIEKANSSIQISTRLDVLEETPSYSNDAGHNQSSYYMV